MTRVIAISILAGPALVLLLGWCALTYAPETLLDLGDAVYDEHGHYQGMRQ